MNQLVIRASTHGLDRPRRGILVGITALLLAAGSVSAATAPRIAPGDVLRVEVGTRTDLAGQYTVSDAGSITMQGIGTVRAQGRTPTELADDISRRLSLIERNIPPVTVTILESRSRKVLVIGAVLVPGTYGVDETMTAWDAITQAGGAATDADLTRVEIIPGETAPGRVAATVDLSAAIRENRLAGLEKLQAGDTVRVPRAGAAAVGAAGMVYVFGAIGAQGAIPIDQAPDLMAAVLRAGGPSGAADMGRIEIVRRDGNRLQHLRVNLQDYVQNSNPSGNVPLRPGDTIYLPARSHWGGSFFSILGIVSPILALATSILALSR